MHLSKAMIRLGLVGFLTLAPAAYGAAQENPDEAIESKIESVLKKDSILAPRSIDVESEQGRVKLTGAVRTADERARAEKLARIAGVTGIVNELTIDPNVERSRIDRAADATKEGLNKAVDATAKGTKKAAEGAQKGAAEAGKGVGKAAEKTADAIGTAGEKVSDASLNTRVKGEFAKDPQLKNVAIRVDTKDHVVTLRGTVASDAVKARAEEVATRTKDVARVVNEIVVKQ
jgi:osmotically-inducible protein OsmY